VLANISGKPFFIGGTSIIDQRSDCINNEWFLLKFQ